MLQRGDALAGAALMVILAVIGSVTVPLTLALVLSTAQVGAAGGISIAVGPPGGPGGSLPDCALRDRGGRPGGVRGVAAGAR